MAQSRPSIAGGLHWVRGELDQSLARARGLIEQYMDAPEDQLPLQQAAVELHQVRGTAAMIQCAGVALLADEMKRRDWYVQPQLTYGSSPANIHLTATATSLDRVDELLADLAAATKVAAAHERAPEFQQLLDGLGDVDPDAFTDDMYAGMLGAVGLGGGASLPDEMADINAVLDALAPELREKLLLAFLNDLYA